MDNNNSKIFCPKCQKLDIIRSGHRYLTLSSGIKKSYTMFRCKICGYQFSENTLNANSKCTCVIFDEDETESLAKRAKNNNMPIEEYVKYQIFRPHTKKNKGGKNCQDQSK